VRRVGLLGLLALLAAACGGSSGGLSRTIVLDRSIGPVRLLESQQNVEHALGKGVTVLNDQMHGHEVRYPKLGLELAYPPPGGAKHTAVAFVILTTSSRYRTRDGVGVGSSLDHVKLIKGIECFNSDSDCQHGNVHNKPGTGFALRDGTVWRVVITILD
jgi:hypothetical protein